jgi:hypothetical protein
MADPHGPRVVLPGTRVLLRAFSALTLLAFIALFVLASHTDRFFAWTIAPPATAAFVGAAYAAGCLLVVLSLREREWSRVRVPFVTVLVFTVVTLAATLLHLDPFHFDAPGLIARGAAWFWVAVYVVVPLGMLLMLVAQQRLPGADPPARMPLPGALAAVLVVQGSVFLAVGVVLFADPGTESALWPWPLTPLTARTVAAWLLAFGAGTLLALVDRDLERLELAAVAYAVFGALEIVVLLLNTEVVRWNSAASYGYLALTASTVLSGAYAVRLTRAGARTRERAPT